MIRDDEDFWLKINHQIYSLIKIKREFYNLNCSGHFIKLDKKEDLSKRGFGHLQFYMEILQKCYYHLLCQ